MNEQTEKLTEEESMAAMLMALFLLVPRILVYGYALRNLWVWFAVPTFGVREISMAQAYGLSLIPFILKLDLYPKSKPSKAMEIWFGFWLHMIGVGVTLLVGWVVYRFWI